MEKRYSASSSIAVKITVVAFIITAIAIAAYSAITYYLTLTSTSNLGLKLFGIGAVIMILLAVAMYSGIKYAVQPINRVADVIEHVSNLNLTSEYDDEIDDLIDRNDEIGYIASCTKEMKSNLTNIAGDIQRLVG